MEETVEAMHAQENADEINEEEKAKETEQESVEELPKENRDAGEEIQDKADDGDDIEEKPRKRGRRKLAPEQHNTPKRTPIKQPATPLSDRPSRERKSIKRFSDLHEEEKEKVKELIIKKGSGDCLKDIPNVVFKLSKRKASEEPVQLLHRLIYGKRGKPHQTKNNILQFSGFVWGVNEDKEKGRIREKLEKCVKENLFQVADLLDLNIPKSTTKKEDLVLRLFDFLESPHTTTEKLLEKVQKSKEKKRKRSSFKGSPQRASTPAKRRKHAIQSDLEEEDMGLEQVEDEAPLPVEEEHEQEPPDEGLEQEAEDEPGEEPKKKRRKRSSIVSKEVNSDIKSTSPKMRAARSARRRAGTVMELEEELAGEQPTDEDVGEEAEKKGKPSRRRGSSKAESKPTKGLPKLDENQSVFDPLEEDLEDEMETKQVESKAAKKGASRETKPPSKTLGRRKKTDKGMSKGSLTKSKTGEGKDANRETKKAKEEKSKPSPPTDDELRLAICYLLQDADFSKVTFTDVVKQLEVKFDVDLAPNKGHVKLLIQDEISKLVDADGDEDEVAAEAEAASPTLEK